MKKILSIAVMALTMFCLASCGGGSSEYTKGGPQPAIDKDKSTVNGVKYDDTTEQCWIVTCSTQGPAGKQEVTTYEWMTLFELQASYQMAMWTYAQNGIEAKWVYAAALTSDTRDKCISNNN